MAAIDSLARRKCHCRLLLGSRMRVAVYNSNINSARPAATAITCRPSTIKEIGADSVFPPSTTRQASRPVFASNAKRTPPDAPNTNPPSVDRRPLYSLPDVDEVYDHFWLPVDASSARIRRVGGSVEEKPLPKKNPVGSCLTFLLAACFVKTELSIEVGTKINFRF